MSSSEQVELELGQKAFVLGGGIRSDGSDPAHRRRGVYEPLTRRQILFRVAVVITAACSCLAVGVGIGVVAAAAEHVTYVTLGRRACSRRRRVR